jgi:hypothetical protein
MILDDTAIAIAPAGQTAPCPKCASDMVLACISPHPKNVQMDRHTYLCAMCNQTRTYVLPAAVAVEQQNPVWTKDDQHA